MVKLAYITDLHTPPLPRMAVSEISIKRILGYTSWHSKRKAVHIAPVLAALKAELEKAKPDHIHIGGDITNLGLKAEYEQTRKTMEELGKPKTLSLVPGNHDHYMRKIQPLIDTHWDEYARGDDGESFPYVRRIGKIAIIALNSAIPTLPFMANGRVSSNQLKKLPYILETLKAEGYTRIISLHHPPQENACAHHRGLWDAQTFRDVLIENGAELILHGHLHCPLKADIGDIPVRGAGSCSTRYGHFMMINDTKTGDLEIHHHHYDTENAVFTIRESELIKTP